MRYVNGCSLCYLVHLKQIKKEKNVKKNFKQETCCLKKASYSRLEKCVCVYMYVLFSFGNRRKQGKRIKAMTVLSLLNCPSA